MAHVGQKSTLGFIGFVSSLLGFTQLLCILILFAHIPDDGLHSRHLPIPIEGWHLNILQPDDLSRRQLNGQFIRVPQLSGFYHGLVCILDPLNLLRSKPIGQVIPPLPQFDVKPGLIFPEVVGSLIQKSNRSIHIPAKHQDRDVFHQGFEVFLCFLTFLDFFFQTHTRLLIATSHLVPQLIRFTFTTLHHPTGNKRPTKQCSPPSPQRPNNPAIGIPGNNDGKTFGGRYGVIHISVNELHKKRPIPLMISLPIISTNQSRFTPCGI